MATTPTIRYARAPPTRIRKTLPGRKLQAVGPLRAFSSDHPRALTTKTIDTLPRQLQMVELRRTPSSIHSGIWNHGGHCWGRTYTKMPETEVVLPHLCSEDRQRELSLGSVSRPRRALSSSSACLPQDPIAETPATPPPPWQPRFRGLKGRWML